MIKGSDWTWGIGIIRAQLDGLGKKAAQVNSAAQKETRASKKTKADEEGVHRSSFSLNLIDNRDAIYLHLKSLRTERMALMYCKLP